DLFPATPSQLHVFRALGREVPPRFAHLPLLVGPDGRKLSKRLGAVAVEEFRAQGYLPEALVNYLALLGWALDDHTEHFTLAELERVFELERVSRNPAQFDPKKLEALNGWHLRALSPDDFAARSLEFVRRGGYPDADQDLPRRAAAGPPASTRSQAWSASCWSRRSSWTPPAPPRCSTPRAAPSWRPPPS